MDTAQHAGNILEAWRFRDLSKFNAALDGASQTCSGGVSVSLLEAEREEMLQSIVEHLRRYDIPQQFENLLSCAAFTLLHHLSKGRNPKENLSAVTKNFLKNFKVQVENVRNGLQNSNEGRATEPAIGRTTHDISSN
jgi:hypothetical protein